MPTLFPIKAFIDNYIWAILPDDLSTFSCIDPGDANLVLDFAKDNKLTLTHILLTHHHADHIGGVAQLVKSFPNCVVYGPEDSRILQALPAKPCSISGVDFEILQTPGHTSTHISYYAPKLGWLFCGDTLFSAGCGRVFDGTMEDLHRSLTIFKNLPDNTLVFCAHEYTRKNLDFAQYVEPHNTAIQTYLNHLMSNPTPCSLPSTIEREKSVNPFLRTDVLDVQQFAVKQGINPTDSLAVFTALREAKNKF